MDNLSKDNLLELENSLEAKEKSKKLKKKIIAAIILLLMVILFIVFILLLKPKEHKDEIDIFDGVIKAKYIINDYNKKIKIINQPKDNLTISVFSNDTKIMDLKAYEFEIFFNKSYGNEIELKYKGKLTNLIFLFMFIEDLEEINLNGINTREVKRMDGMFYGCKNLKYVHMNNLDTTNLENIDNMFFNCQNLEYIDMVNFDTKNVVTSRSTFENCFKLSKINIKSFDFTKTTDASYMFKSCHSIIEIALKNDDTQSNIIDIISIFNGDYALKEIDLTNFNKKTISRIDYVFNDCKSLTSIDLSKFDTSQVTSISDLFSNCHNLTSIDIAQLDLSNTRAFTYTFRNCTSIKSLDLSKFNTNKAESLTGTFYGCSSLISVDLSNYIIDIASLVDLFCKCTSLQNVTISVKRVLGVNRMFKDCYSLKYVDLSKFNAKEIKLRDEFFPKEVTNATVVYNSSIFENIKNFITNKKINFIDAEGYNGAFEATYNVEDLSQKIKIINIPKDKINMSVFSNNTKIMDLKENETEIFFDKIYNNKIKIKYSGKLTNLYSLFSGIIHLKTINLIEMDTNEVTTMEKMFYGCTSLTSVTMNNVQTPNLENTISMFENCEQLQQIYMNKFDTKNVAISKSMFSNCKNLNRININSYFDITKCEDASYMFKGCNKLKEVHLKNDGAHSVPINIKSIFNGAYSLERIYFNGFDKKIIKDISYAFNDCLNLKSINLSKFDTKQVTSIYSTFSNCTKLLSIDIAQLDLSNTKEFSYAFRNCASIKSLDLSKFNTNKAEAMTGTFYGCSSLISVDLSNYLIDVTSLDYLFCKCTSLQNVTISVKRVQSVNAMFKECYSLKYLDLSNFNAKEIKLRTDFFPKEVTNATVVYNSSIFENIKKFIPNKEIVFIDINIDLY